MKKIITGAVFIALWAACALGQNTPPSDDYRKVEVFAGYSANNLLSGNPENLDDLDSNSTPTYRGWNVSAAYNFSRYVGVKADVSGHYGKFTLLETPTRVRANGSFYNYLAGIQIKDNRKSKRFAPFLQVLGGVATSKVKIDLPSFSGVPDLRDSTTGLAMAIGGGLDLKVNKRVSIRLIQADYNPTFFGGGNQNNVRLGFGIVFH
jgi:opacity protein-like surface antigen